MTHVKAKRRLPRMRIRLHAPQVCSAATLCWIIAVSTHGCAPTTAVRVATPDAGETPAIVAQEAVFHTSVAPRPDEDLAAPCRYEVTLLNPSRSVRGLWVIFERSRDTRLYYQNADVRAFARAHDWALLYPSHCQSKSPETQGDMNVDPAKGIGRALFSALSQLAQTSGHAELASAKLILLGFSGAGSLVGRLAGFAPDRVLAVIATNPGHFDPLGMETIGLSPLAATIPQLILAGSADAVSGTQRPYAYFRRYFDQGAPLSYAYLLQRFRDLGNARMVRALEQDPPAMQVPLPRSYMKLRDGAMHALGVGATRDMQSVITGVFLASWLHPEYTLAEELHIWRGKFACDRLLWDSTISLDLTRVVRALALPVYFLHGAHDHSGSFPLAKDYTDPPAGRTGRGHQPGGRPW